MDNRMTTPRVQGTAASLQSTRLRFRRRHLVLTAVLAFHPLAATAQTVTLPAPTHQPGVIRWWEGAIVLGGLSGLMLLDRPAQRFSQLNRSQTGNDLAHGFRHFGQPEVYGTVTLGLLGAGLISGNDEIARAGGRLATTLAVAGAASGLAKLTFGRPRPSESLDADGYVPFSGQEAMPSGHTTMAFALATSLADDINRTWARVGLYAVATGVGWSRVNDNKHWLTDVAAGAVLGITSAKLVSGRWRIFNLRTPRFLVSPGQATVAWGFSF
jgi:membrane-associated phospholipid phosphatase